MRRMDQVVGGIALIIAGVVQVLAHRRFGRHSDESVGRNLGAPVTARTTRNAQRSWVMTGLVFIAVGTWVLVARPRGPYTGGPSWWVPAFVALCVAAGFFVGFMWW